MLAVNIRSTRVRVKGVRLWAEVDSYGDDVSEVHGKRMMAFQQYVYEILTPRLSSATLLRHYFLL
jgi:hypothetical protein